MKILHTAIAATLCLISIACNKAAKETKSTDEVALQSITNKYKAEEPDQNYIADSTGKPQSSGELIDKKKSPTSQPIPNPDWDKKIIKTASLNLEVKDYHAFYSSFREKVRSFGGYVAQEEQNQSDYKIENTLVIKVPVDQFDNAVAQLTTNVERINEKKISSQDVTSEFVDTKSRIEAKKQVRLRYMDLLKQAKNMEEILDVQSEINGIQEEIESATGRVEYLGHSSAFSTINLTYYQVLNSSAKDTDSPSFGSKLSNAFKIGWSWITDFLIGLISIWPLFFLVAFIYFLYKKVKIKNAKA